jgi:hypothetical protein
MLPFEPRPVEAEGKILRSKQVAQSSRTNDGMWF